MMSDMNFNYDVIVIGGGHAGCEAATASANMGAQTCLITMDMNKIAQMSCNPAVGGIAKGQIVREIDALGGQMAKVTDATAIQFRMLNRSKGPAVWSPRAQCDRGKFIWQWRTVIDQTPNLDVWQDQADELIVENHEAVGVKTVWGVEFRAKSVVVTAGTFLNGLMHIGRHQLAGGRTAEPAVYHFTESITRWGIRSDRMKTGTPVRIDGRTVDFSKMEIQDGEEDFHQFSYMGAHRVLKQLPCWTCFTNQEVHDTLKSGLADSPLFNGQIKSIGPRYCLSVETKLMTFPDKDQHPLFLEPEGETTQEMYLNGFSSSLPMEIQIEALKKIPAFRDLKVYRPGYAIEYDFFDPTQLRHSLESKVLSGLFFAGQVNGTTGYEEAGGQGTVAGVNAAIHCSGGEPMRMHRDESYIGVLIDDLVTKGVDEPYRMFTSRAEFRILLRQDDADLRLTPISHNLGLADEHRYSLMSKKYDSIKNLTDTLNSIKVSPEEINPLLSSINSSLSNFSKPLSSFLSRPDVVLSDLIRFVPRGTLEEIVSYSPSDCDKSSLSMYNSLPYKNNVAFNQDNYINEILSSVEILIKYKGYIERESNLAAKILKLESLRIPDNFDYNKVTSISYESRQKLMKHRPQNISQASRIPGVSPADISVLLIFFGR